MHGDQVIGTAVPASSEPATVKSAAGDQRSDLRRQDWEEPSGSDRASREEAPEESSSSSATRLLMVFGLSVSEAGRKRGRPKKGRGTLDGFGFEELRFQKTGRKGRKTSEPSGGAVE